MNVIEMTFGLLKFQDIVKKLTVTGTLVQSLALCSIKFITCEIFEYEISISRS